MIVHKWSDSAQEKIRRLISSILIRCFLTVLVLASPPCRSAAEKSVETLLVELKSSDAEVRIEALRGLQTSLDPRIPDAMLGLLGDEGNSIRRLAARAVGSRWWQIPNGRVRVFSEALMRRKNGEQEDELNMVHRALGLLNRDYRGPMFARSPNKRWVIYERRGLPCLIDTKTGTEELLGWSSDTSGLPIGSWQGNGTLEGFVLWQDAKEVAALCLAVGRKWSVVWVWQHPVGVRKLESDEILRALGYQEGELLSGGGFFSELKNWKGDELRLEVMFSTEPKGEIIEHTALIGWNASKGKVRVISR